MARARLSLATLWAKTLLIWSSSAEVSDSCAWTTSTLSVTPASKRCRVRSSVSRVDLKVSLGELHLTGCRLQIEVGIAHVALHLALEVFEFGLPLGQGSLCLLDVSFGAASLPDGNIEGGRGAERCAGLGRVGSDGSVVAVDGERGQALVAGRGKGVLGGADLRLGGLECPRGGRAPDGLRRPERAQARRRRARRR